MLNSILNEILVAILSHIDWAIYFFLVVFIIVLLMVLYKFHRGSITLNFGLLKIEPNRALEKLQWQFEELNNHSTQQVHVMKLLNQVYLSYSKWAELSGQEYLSKMNDFYNFFFPGIISLITKNKNNTLRAAIFYKTNRDTLKILHGSGYSPEGKNSLELSLYDSKAGYCFINKEYFHSDDLRNDSSYKRNPKSSKHYHSLICVPIMYNGEPIGVLNLDGLQVDSFDKDDIDYITYFANSVSPILYKELELKKQEEGFFHEEKSG